MAAFGGAKLAILVRDHVVVILRDDSPAIPWPGHWDLPGGGREGEETPVDCALRELREELGLVYPPAALAWSRAFLRDSGPTTWFFGLRDDAFDPGAVRFGEEGQGWRLMPLSEFLSHPLAIPHLQDRLRQWLQAAPEGLP